MGSQSEPVAAARLQPDWLSERTVARAIPDLEPDPRAVLQVDGNFRLLCAEVFRVPELDPLTKHLAAIARYNFRNAQREQGS